MALYTVKQVAKMAGLSVRALHHYDQIGLLKPASVGQNGYRYYGRDELLRLQQILFHRELEFPLEAIAQVPDKPDFDRVAALRAAFDSVMKDPDFLTEAQKEQLDINPVSGEQLQQIVSDIVSTPKATTDRLSAIIALPEQGNTGKK